MSELGKFHGASTIMRKTLDWNRSRISMLEAEAVPQDIINEYLKYVLEFYNFHRSIRINKI
jgi:hypothetical protein